MTLRVRAAQAEARKGLDGPVSVSLPSSDPECSVDPCERLEALLRLVALLRVRLEAALLRLEAAVEPMLEADFELFALSFLPLGPLVDDDDLDVRVWDWRGGREHAPGEPRRSNGVGWAIRAARRSAARRRRTEAADSSSETMYFPPFFFPPFLPFCKGVGVGERAGGGGGA